MKFIKIEKIFKNGGNYLAFNLNYIFNFDKTNLYLDIEILIILKTNVRIGCDKKCVICGDEIKKLASIEKST